MLHTAHSEIAESTRSRAVRAAQGLEPFDTLIAGGQIIDVITGEIRWADIGLTGNMIASVHATGTRSDAQQVVNIAGKIVAPGLIDTHVHFESSHMLPHYYASVVVPQGTTTIFFDPHELANVMGVAGVRYAVSATRGLPLRCLCQASSSVPSAPALEVSGASFGSEEMHEMLSWPEVIGVAEMMDMNGVLSGLERMVGIAGEARAAGKLLEGHARGLTGAPLQGYVAAGVGSDHEITSGDDLLEKLRAGLAIELRGSHDHVMPSMIAALEKLPHLSSQIMICTDDVPPDMLVERGGLVDVLRRFIKYGMQPVDAVRFATFNAAIHLGRRDLGVICAGRIADLVVLDDLGTLSISDVYASGRLVAHYGQLCVPVESHGVMLPKEGAKIAPLKLPDFHIHVPDLNAGYVTLRSIKGVRFSEWSQVRLKVENGKVILPHNADLNLIFSIHRHGRKEAVPHVAIQEGLAQLRGAIATTYEHDSHNLYAIGGNEDDMLLAANALITSGGGIAVAQGGKVLAVIKFPIAGMLATEAPEVVAKAFREVREAADKVVEWKAPHWSFRTLEGMSLACNPFPYLTDMGLVDGKTGELVSLILEQHPA